MMPQPPEPMALAATNRHAQPVPSTHCTMERSTARKSRFLLRCRPKSTSHHGCTQQATCMHVLACTGVLATGGFTSHTRARSRAVDPGLAASALTTSN